MEAIATHRKRRRAWTFLVCVLVVSLGTINLGCKKTPDCKRYATRTLSCTSKLKDKNSIRPMIWSFCVQQLAKKATKALMLQKLVCSTKKTCEEFLKCQLLAEGLAKVQSKIRKLKTHQHTIAKSAIDGKYYAAQAGCVKDSLAQELLKSNQLTAVKAAKQFYTYCIGNLPNWLEKVSRAKKVHEDIQSCFDTNFGHRAQATTQQLQTLKDSCAIVLFAQKFRKVEKQQTTYLKRRQFPWQCNPKEAKPLLESKHPQAKSWLTRYQSLCYQKLGFRYLQSEMKKQSKEAKPFCSYYARKIVKGFDQWKLAVPKQKIELTYFRKLCKASTED